MMNIDIQPFKEPRGFIKAMQWIFAICAFAITVDYSGKYGFEIVCDPPATTQPGVVNAYAYAKYPFNMEHEDFTLNTQPACGNQFRPISLLGNSKSDSVFFVFTGVVSFIYATWMIGVHLLADKQYMSNRIFLLSDFFVTIILAVFWIAGASAWAHGVSNVSSAMKANEWVEKQAGFKFVNFYYSSVSKLVISVLFGFINFVLWSGNIWFLYKETSAYLNAAGGGAPPPNMQQSSANMP